MRMEIIANNVANALSTGPLPDAPNAANFPPAYVPERVNQVAATGGGTSATVGTVTPSFVPEFDPTAPFANANGEVAAPNVDLANEAVQQVIARYTFAANAKVIQVASEMMKTLLDIKT